MKNFGQLSSAVISRCKIEDTDSISLANLLIDANDGQNIIATMKEWDELYKITSFVTTDSDGDKLYPLADDLDKVETMAISSPIASTKPLIYIPRKGLLATILQKTNIGETTPSRWYFGIPTISSTTLLETKNISFDVMPDQAYTITYSYKATPPQITENSHYPFFPRNCHHILEWYMEWKYAERNPDSTLDPAYFRGEWENAVQQLLGAYPSKLIDNVPIQGPIINASK